MYVFFFPIVLKVQIFNNANVEVVLRSTRGG